MRRRELALMAAVLLPFALLVIAGFLVTADAPGRGSTQSGLDLARPERLAARLYGSAPDAPSPLPAEAGRADAAGSGAAEVPAALEAPLAAVRAEVRRCFVELRAGPTGPISVTMTFRPLPDGGFAEVRVERDSAQDPYLDACLTDVFEEVGYPPSGREDFLRATHTFVFDPKAQER